MPPIKGAHNHGLFDLIFEATGFPPIAFESMQALAKNSVLVLSSVTGATVALKFLPIRSIWSLCSEIA